MTDSTRKSASHAAGARIEKSGPRKQSRGRSSIRSTTAAPRAPRGRGRGRCRTPISDQRAQLAKRTLEERSLAEANPVATKIARFCNGFSNSKPLSLYFVQLGQLENLPDAETIALNLIAFMLMEGNWDPRLRLNILSSSCFLFASSLTGLGNQASDIARTFEPDLDIHTNLWITSLTSRGIPVADVDTVASMMRLRAEDVEDGHAILWDMKHAFLDLAGDYAEELEAMPMPRGYSEIFEKEMPEEVEREDVGQEEEQQRLPEIEHKDELATRDALLVVECDAEVSEKSETMAEHSLGVTMEPELVELDDFETSIEEYEES